MIGRPGDELGAESYEPGFLRQVEPFTTLGHVSKLIRPRLTAQKIAPGWVPGAQVSSRGARNQDYCLRALCLSR